MQKVTRMGFSSARWPVLVLLMILSSFVIAEEGGGSPQMNGFKGWIMVRFAEQSALGMVGILFQGTNRQPTVDYILSSGTVLKTEKEYRAAIGQVRAANQSVAFYGPEEFTSMGYNDKLFAPYTHDQLTALGEWSHVAGSSTIQLRP